MNNSNNFEIEKLRMRILQGIWQTVNPTLCLSVPFEDFQWSHLMHFESQLWGLKSLSRGSCKIGNQIQGCDQVYWIFIHYLYLYLQYVH